MAGISSMLEEGLPWGPMIDGDLITRPTIDSLRAGVGGGKPLVLGSTNDEFTMATNDVKNKLRFIPVSLLLGKMIKDRAARRAYLAVNKPQRKKGTAAMLGRFMTDALFRTAIVRIAEARGSHKTWVYQFVWPSPSLGWAGHCLDVPFWFDCLDAEKIDFIAGANPPQALADEVHGAAVALVRDGAPGWPAWSDQAGTARVFDVGGPAVAANALDEVRPLV